MDAVGHVMQSVWSLVRSGPNFDGRDQRVQDAVRAAIQAEVMAEREACAALCEGIDSRCPDCAAHNDHDQCTRPEPMEYAAAIRARGE